MKRASIALISVAALAAGSTVPAVAAVKKPVPVTKTYYFHAVDNFGTGNGNVNALFGESPTGVLPMDAKKPTGTTDVDYGTFGVANNPNHECYGNSLVMHPTWAGAASGTLVKKLTVTFFARSTPGRATVQLFADPPGEVACNDDFPFVRAETTVELPSGKPNFAKVTATLTLSKPVVVKQGFAIQIQTENVLEPQASDIGFDSTTTPSAVTWTCLPKPGKKSC